jgi:2-oxoglutarate dehydrogenase E2 component (dihydrolipoamide succinyltransferase)
MAFEVRIPSLGESVTEGVILSWAHGDGDRVQADQPLLELETDKASVELAAERGGVLEILKAAGETVAVGDLIARIDEAGAPYAAAGPGAARVPESVAEPVVEQVATRPARAPAGDAAPPLSPAVRRLVEERGLDPGTIPATGKGGRLSKEDVLAFLERSEAKPERSGANARPGPARPGATSQSMAAPARRRVPSAPALEASPADEERIPMSPIRRRIAERLVSAQHTAAILTTFNEIDMTAVMALRKRHGERFKDTHGVGLGFMSFFARACIRALQEIPAINAEIRGTDIVYRRFVHLGVAVGTERGLVVPVVHDADRLSFAGIEREIGRLAGLAREGRIALDDLSGGTFTISNGGVYGSLLSTPILNPPQSGILGMHKIEKRPVVIDDQIVIRPMMYVALSYDHRIVDGEQAVTFLIRIKDGLEDPSRLLLDL